MGEIIVKFKSVSEYRKDYKVIAHFYTNEKGDKSRLFADVVRNDSMESPIDAYLIMINPGSCKEIASFKSDGFYINYTVVEAKSDPSQKCVMALMDNCQLKKIRMVNLSDVVCADLKEAIKKMSIDGVASSLFSNQRQIQRNEILQSNAPYIVCWGTDSLLFEFKEQAMKYLSDKRVLGIMVNPDTYAFKHIKPALVVDQEIVVEELAKQIMKG